MTSQTPIHSQSQREVNLSPFNLLALPANMVYPPLPPINDERIYKMVTTHSSLYMDKKNSMNLDPKTMVEDYEKLEHVGDALLGAMVTVLLHDLFPMLGEGPATTLKGSLVSNATLAKISDKYQIPRKLQANPSALRTARAQVKTKASMFEAWIAGVFYTVLSGIGESDKADEGTEADDESSEADEVTEVEQAIMPDAPMPQATRSPDQPEPSASPLDDELDSALSKSLTLEELPFVKNASRNDIADETSKVSPVREEPSDINMGSSTASLPDIAHPIEPLKPMQAVAIPASDTLVPVSNLKYRWLAMTALDEWLRPLFTPIAHSALSQLRLEQERFASLGSSGKPCLAPEVIAEDAKALGSAGPLNIMVTKKEAQSMRYEAEEVPEGWKITCILVNNDGTIVKGEGVRANQKTAKALAAYRVLTQIEGEEKDE